MKCLDCYALVEINNGNPKFMRFLEEEVIIPDLILAEFYGVMYRRYNKKTADHWFKKLSYLSKKIEMDILIMAVVFRIDNKKRNLSFFDCVGYMFSKENNMNFVTGDKEFEKFSNVEFVK